MSNTNSSPIQVANDCKEQVSPLLDIESSSKKRPRVIVKRCSGSKKPRTNLTIVMKKEICQKRVEIAAEYKIGESTVGEILKSKVVSSW